MGLYDNEEDKKINQEEQNSSEPFFGPDDESDNEVNTESDDKGTEQSDSAETDTPSENESGTGHADESAKEEKSEKESSGKENIQESSKDTDTGQTQEKPSPDRSSFDAPIDALQKSPETFDESLKRFEAISEKVTADLPQIMDASAKIQAHIAKIEGLMEEEKELRSQICQCTHWLENTNKNFSEIMTAMPKLIHNVYIGEAQKYEIKFKKTFKMLDDMIKAEMSSVKQPGINYFVVAVILIIQALVIVYLLR